MDASVTGQTQPHKRAVVYVASTLRAKDAVMNLGTEAPAFELARLPDSLESELAQSG